MATRQEIISRLRANPSVSVLVIGAGINGIATFRDLAHQGVNVLLVDRADFGSGASAASSHMLHGGIRYLENGEFRLVREALTERNLMLRNAPHQSKPLPTTIPIFSWFSGLLNAPLKFVRLRDKPAERGALVIKIGLVFYDIFARNYKVMPNHRFYMRRQALARYPGLNPNIKCVAMYYDAFMPCPERICLELVQDGESANPDALALNYMSVIGGEGANVTLRDELTGETCVVRPQVVVNAAGPWIDFANRALGRQTKYIGGTKGSHLILNNPELYQAVNGTEFFFENNDGRIVLILPYVNGTVMVGTSDIRIDNPDDAVCTDDEIDYFLTMIDRVFPHIKVDRSQIVFTFSGVRPLVSSEAGFTGNVSRDHVLKVNEPDGQVSFPVLSLIGGKWTTFRAFGEQTADAVLKRLGVARKVNTATLKLGGGKNYPKTDAEREAWLSDLHQRTAVPLEQLRVMFERYGTHTAEIAAFMADDTDKPLRHYPSYTRREVMYLAHTEKIEHLDDLILRRSLIAWLGGLSEPLLAELAEVLGEALGWSAERQRDEIERTVQILSEKHRLDLRAPVSEGKG